MMQLWLSASPIQNVSGPDERDRQAEDRRVGGVERSAPRAGPTNRAIRASSCACGANVPSMKRTAPGPAPNACDAASAAASTSGWFDSDR